MSAQRHQLLGFQLRLQASLRQQLEKLAERNASKVTAEIVTAIRERLERFELWPPTQRKEN
jgi:hypothetical protein